MIWNIVLFKWLLEKTISTDITSLLRYVLRRHNIKVSVYDEHFVHKYFTHYQIAIFLSKPMHWILFAEILMAKSVLKIRPCLKYLWRLKTQFIEEVNYTDNWILDYVCIGAQSRLCLFGNRKKVTKNRI